MAAVTVAVTSFIVMVL